MTIKNFSADHHTFLISLEGRAAVEDVAIIIEKELGLIFKGKTVFTQKFLADSFSIELAREIKASQMSRVLEEERRVIVIGFNSITTQAQNALLKVLEEPSAYTYLFILTPNQSLILETVRSRSVNLEISLNENNSEQTTEPFLQKNHRDRMDEVKKLLEDRSKIDQFFMNLELEISKRKDRVDFSNPKLRDLLRKSKFYSQSGSSAAKYLLEELALTLPN